MASATVMPGRSKDKIRWMGLCSFQKNRNSAPQD